jgi:NitT/TauT family transport system ATP-binding protein
MASQSSAVISIARVGHVFRTKGRRVQALLETDLQIHDREFLTIVGPSGCGKSTLMNIIVGLFPPSSGEVLYRGKRHVGVNRSIGYVTQADNLYPWRTLRQNVEFPLELRMVGKGERRERAERLIHRVGLGGFEDSYPHELSGGMRLREAVVPDGKMTAAASDAYQRVLLQTGHLKEKVAFDAVFTNQYLPA